MNDLGAVLSITEQLNKRYRFRFRLIAYEG